MNKNSQNGQGVVLMYNTSQIVNLSQFTLTGDSCNVINLFGNSIPAQYTPPHIVPPPFISLPFNVGSIISGTMAQNVSSFQISNANHTDTQVVLKISAMQSVTSIVNGISVATNMKVPNAKPTFAVFTSGSSVPVQISIATVLAQYQTLLTALLSEQPELKTSNVFLAIDTIFVDSISNPTLVNNPALVQLEHFNSEHFNMNNYIPSKKNNCYVYILLLLAIIAAIYLMCID